MHDDLHDHYHISEEEWELIEKNDALWSTERVTLKTVGIDIGSSTMHLIFSKIVLQREGKNLSSRFVVVNREVLYESPIYLTPYTDPSTIDSDEVGHILQHEYSYAGETPETVDTGAVIVTGEAAMKENAGNILSLFAGQAGKFVCATAGPNLEATLAAYGSGAVAQSHHKKILNIDIGGGTTKFALSQGGQLLGTAAVSIGARLMAWNEKKELIRVEKTVGKFLEPVPRLGEQLSSEQEEQFLHALTDRLFELIEDILGNREASPRTKELYITPELPRKGGIDEIMFSGGVSEYIYGSENKERGDFGLALGSKIRQIAEEKGLKPGVPTQRIRATVIGASQYTVQLSGNTIFLSGDAVLPMRNLPVISLDFRDGVNDFSHMDRLLTEAYQRFDMVKGEAPVALGIRWPGGIDYSVIREFCEQLCRALPYAANPHSQIPILLAFDTDVGGLVGRLLQEEFSVTAPIVSIDQIGIKDLDFIDVGELLKDSGVVPVVIKSLVFK